MEMGKRGEWIPLDEKEDAYARFLNSEFEA